MKDAGVARLDGIMEELKPSRDKETPRGDLCEFSLNNWKRIPADVRRQVICHIRNLASVEQLNTWRDQHARGMRIGSDDPWFHTFVGMALRNACRKSSSMISFHPSNTITVGTTKIGMITTVVCCSNLHRRLPNEGR